jgi:TetR/AcrR family transcriptional regulator, mexCD-oprJ operon repressor
MSKGDGLRDRTAAAIIDSAAALLAERGDAASMEEIAAAAGIGRATLYRYFRTREDLFTAMAAASVAELAARIAEANLDAVPVEEAVARLARGIIATGNKYVALTADGTKRSDAHPDLRARVVEPINAVFRRAAAEGSLRADVPPDVLTDLFSGLVRGALDATAAGRRGVEETAAAVTTVFLRGARR